MGKMSNGIIKRGSTYSYVIREMDPATGKSRQRWKGGFKTRSEALEGRTKALSASYRGESVAPSRRTLAQYLREWLDQVDVKPKTKAGYEYHVEHYVVPRIGAVRLQDVRRPSSPSSTQASGLQAAATDQNSVGGPFRRSTERSAQRSPRQRSS